MLSQLFRIVPSNNPLPFFLQPLAGSPVSRVVVLIVLPLVIALFYLPSTACQSVRLLRSTKLLKGVSRVYFQKWQKWLLAVLSAVCIELLCWSTRACICKVSNVCPTPRIALSNL